MQHIIIDIIHYIIPIPSTYTRIRTHIHTHTYTCIYVCIGRAVGVRPVFP